MDTKKRCWWLNNASDLYINYHDNEWGVPSHDDSYLFEMFILESFQAGLSWLTILNKRENFRSAFDNFDPIRISEYNDIKVDELMNNEGIIRSRAKILAAIENAKTFLKVKEEFGTFSNYIWSFSNNKVLTDLDDKYEPRTKFTDAIAKDLKKRGFKFMGPTTTYAYIQAIGIVDAHDLNCYKHPNNLSVNKFSVNN